MLELIKSKSVLALLVFAMTIVGIRAFNISYKDLNSGRHFNRGDAESDKNTMSAIRYFHDHGLWQSKLRPMHHYKKSDPSTAEAYTHYPALPDVVHGAVSIVFDTTNESRLRLFPIALSIVWFFLMVFFLQRELGDRRAVLISLIVLVASNYYLAWADNLHKHMYEELGKWAYVILLLSYHRRTVNRAAALAGLFVLAILIGNASFEPIVFLAVATVGFSCIYEKGWQKILSVSNVLLGLGFIAGFGLHLYLNTLYYGSWELTLADMHGALTKRTGGCADGGDCGMGFAKTLKLPWTALERIERYFLVPGFAFLYLGYRLLKKWWSEKRELFWITAVLGLAGFSWYVAMKQHAAIHHFVGKQPGIFIGLLAGPALLLYADQVRDHWRRRRRGWQLFHSLFILYMAGMAITQQVLIMWWEHGIKRAFE